MENSIILGVRNRNKKALYVTIYQQGSWFITPISNSLNFTSLYKFEKKTNKTKDNSRKI
jgi:hypothetical protein